MMLAKGIILVLVFALFVSRLIPKYLTFAETGEVHLLGVTWRDDLGLLVLLCIAALAVALLILGIKNIRDFIIHRR